MALTLHLDASDTDKLWTTWADGGPHTGTPANGNSVQAWGQEADGTVTPTTAAYSGTAPVYRTGGSSPFLLPCLDFDGSAQELRVCSDTSTISYRASSQFLGTSAKAILFSLYVDAISSTSTFSEGPFGGSDEWGFFVWNDGAQAKLVYWQNDGTDKTVSVNIAIQTPYIVQARHDGTNIYLSLDGGAESQTACGANSTLNAQIRLGRSVNARTDCKIGEVMMWNESSPASLATDAAYFRLKWQGIGGSTARIVTPYAAVTF
jgi:hypothetical protein